MQVIKASETTNVIENKYEVYLQKMLGKGQFGAVYKGMDIQNQKLVAVKIIKIQDGNKQEVEDTIEREIGALNKIFTYMDQENIENIVRLYDFYETDTELILVMEYCSQGNLDDFQKSMPDQVIPEQQAKEIFQQLIDGVYLLHKNKIVHRDLKPQNIIKQNCWKIADLGFANFGNEFSSIRGTPLFMSPQILNGLIFPCTADYTLKCDVYSLGVLFYKLLFNKFPHNGNSFKVLASNIKKNQLVIPNTPPISNQLREILGKMLQVEEEDRFSIFDLKKHSYFKPSIEQFNFDEEPNLDEEDLQLVSYSITKSSNRQFQSKVKFQAKFKKNAKIVLKTQDETSVQKILDRQQKLDRDFQRIRNKINLEQNKINYLLQIYFIALQKQSGNFGFQQNPLFYFQLKFGFILGIRSRLNILVRLLESKDTYIFIKPNLSVCSIEVLQQYFLTEEFQEVIDQLKRIQKLLITEDRNNCIAYNELKNMYHHEINNDRLLQQLNPSSLIADFRLQDYDQTIQIFFNQQLSAINQYLNSSLNSIAQKHDTLVWTYHLIQINFRLSENFKDLPENDFEFNARLYYDKINYMTDSQLYSYSKQKLREIVQN